MYRKLHPHALRRTLCGALASCATLLIAGCSAQQSAIHISANADQIGMGLSVSIEARYTPASGDTQNVLLMPYVNGKRWGAQECPDSTGIARFQLPLPTPGTARIEVIAVPCDTSLWCGLKDFTPYKTGCMMPDSTLRSNALNVEVTPRKIAKRPAGQTRFVAQWEPWFSDESSWWQTAQAVPLLGFYRSTDPQVIRQHLLWFMDSGTDAVLFDWSNNIWGCSSWDERVDGINTLINNTEQMLNVMADMRDEGLPVPQAIIMTGLSNGAPAKMEALNEQLAWIYNYFVRTPRFKGLWMEYQGKPLAVVLDTGVTGVRQGTTESAFRVPFFKQTLAWDAARIDAHRRNNAAVDTSHFTVRWMSSQNQLTGHDKLGYWSWMDGSLHPTVTYRDSTAECTTVNPACFAELGWRAPSAWGRRDGWTYIESFKTAFVHRPQVVMLHQFNEFTGQGQSGYGPDGTIFVDSYSVDRSDDYEPVSLTARGYRGDRGGWGFYYLNLTRALIDLYNTPSPRYTIMAVAPVEVKDGNVVVQWSYVGKNPQKITVTIDDNRPEFTTSDTGITLSSAQLKPGTHQLKVTAEGTSTRFALSPYELDQPLAEPIPVEIIKTFTIQ